MKKLFWLICLMMPFFIFGQPSKDKNKIGLEILGSAYIYALNFERITKKNISYQIGISSVPGTWQINGLNDRSFLYLPFEVRFTKHTKYFLVGTSLGLLQTLVIYRNSSNDLFFRPQIGSFVGLKIAKRIQLKVELYAKSPYELVLNKHQVYAYSRNKWLFWPGVALGYSF